MGMSTGARNRLARSPIAAISICCLLPTNAYSSRFDTRARVAISSVLVAASPSSRIASNAAVRMRARTDAASRLSFVLDIGTKWYHTAFHDGTTWYHNARRETRMLPQLAFFGSIVFSVIAWAIV